MRSQVEILTGLFPADQKRLLLADYRQTLLAGGREIRPGSTLWLTPTGRSRRAVLEDLLDETLPACFVPNVFTFEGFAERLLHGTREDFTPISDASKQTLLRGIIDQFLASGELRYFGSIAHTPGFLELVSSFISELKRDETWPEQFNRVCRESGAADKDRELGALYERYQQLLLGHRLYDAEGRFWSARDVLSRGEFGPFAGLSLIVVDGFADFTHTQHEILEHLSTQAERMRISLPLETPLRRADLFAKSDHACRRIQKLPAVRVTELPGDETETSFTHVAKFLFDNPRDVRRCPHAAGLSVVPTIGRQGEVDMLVERIKRLLLADVDAREIIVAFRNVDEYADVVSGAFDDAGIPFSCDAHTPLSRVGVLKAVHALLQLELHDWSSEQLLLLVGSNYFQPQWDELDTSAAAREVARLLRRIQHDSGRSALLLAAGRAASSGQQPPPSTAEEIGADVSRASAATLLNALSAATERLRDKQTFADWAESLLSAARELGFELTIEAEPDREDDPVFQRDRRSWEVFETVLADAVQAQRILAQDPAKIGLEEFAGHVDGLLRTAVIAPAGSEDGKVLVLDAAQVRQLDSDYLFLAGLSEGSFPTRRGDDCFYTDAERDRLNQRGLRLGHQSSHSQDEMLLFFRLVMRPRRELVLSYPAVGAAGEPLFASPYVAALQSLFEPGALQSPLAGRLDPVPPADRLLSTTDLRARSTIDVLDGHPALFKTMQERCETNAVAQSVLAAAEAAVHRFHTRRFTVFDGMLAEESHAQKLRRRFSPDYQFSATQLESYAGCPFKFFMSHILKITPPDSVQLATDHRLRGILVHEILAALHAETVATGGEIPKDELYGRFQQLVEEYLGRRPGTSALQKALKRIESQLLQEWAVAYAEQSADYEEALARIWNSPPKPTLLEAGFGDVPGEPSQDHPSRHNSLQLGSGEQATHVHGRIDRIDVGEVNSQPVFNVIDYKTGGPPRFDVNDVRTGRSLQLALYTLAVLRLKLAGEARPFQMGYWSIRETGFVAGFKGRRADTFQPLDAAVLQSLESILEETVPRLAAHIRAGAFPVYSQDPDCTGYCAFHTVCRVNQVRPLEEKLDKWFQA